jgi:hypothetical protein
MFFENKWLYLQAKLSLRYENMDNNHNGNDDDEYM